MTVAHREEGAARAGKLERIYFAERCIVELEYLLFGVITCEIKSAGDGNKSSL